MNAWVKAFNTVAEWVNAFFRFFRKTKVEKRKDTIRDLDAAMEKAEDSENSSTKELEEWFSDRS